MAWACKARKSACWPSRGAPTRIPAVRRSRQAGADRVRCRPGRHVHECVIGVQCCPRSRQSEADVRCTPGFQSPGCHHRSTGYDPLRTSHFPNGETAAVGYERPSSRNPNSNSRYFQYLIIANKRQPILIVTFFRKSDCRSTVDQLMVQAWFFLYQILGNRHTTSLDGGVYRFADGPGVADG